MIEIVQQIFGVYQPASDGGVNVEYFVGVGIFCLVLYCAFRLLGIGIGGKK